LEFQNYRKNPVSGPCVLKETGFFDRICESKPRIIEKTRFLALQIPGAKGTLGFISQMSECFCDRCNRMRLSADGWLRSCLLNETGQIDLKTALRDGVSTRELRDRVREILEIKPEINFKQRDSGTNAGNYSRTMSQIGG
jgi:molybdenum cofactor biosynthesis enzyme MoaA